METSTMTVQVERPMMTKTTKESLAIFKKQVRGYVNDLSKLAADFQASVNQAEGSLNKVALMALVDMTFSTIDTLEKNFNVTADAVELTEHIKVD